MASKILPPPGLPRRLALQSAIFAVGMGAFTTGSVVFFTVYVGLTPVQVGVGLSIAGGLELVANLPLGHLADRIGGRRAWTIGALAEAAAFACYPLAHGFWSFVALFGTAALAEVFGGAGRIVYTAAALESGTRVRVLAYERAYLNIGFTIGAGLGAMTLALGSRTGLLLLIGITALALTINGVFVSRFPALTDAPPTAAGASRPSPWGVLRDRPYASMSVLFAVIVGVNALLFANIIPLWAVSMTDAPRPVLGLLFGLNTVLAVLLQVRAARGSDSLGGAARLARWAALATAVACPVAALSGATHGWLTVVLLSLAVVLVTATELWAMAASWFVQTEVPPPGRRGVYTGLDRSATGVTRMIGPAGLTFLAIGTGGWGWWIIAALFLVAGAAVGPVFGWVENTTRIGAGASEVPQG